MIEKIYGKQHWDDLPEEVRNWIKVALNSDAKIKLSITSLVVVGTDKRGTTLKLEIESDTHDSKYHEQ